MLTPRDEAMLHARTVRELQQELLVLRTELQDCHTPKRKHWLEARIDAIVDIINNKLSPA